MASDAPNATTDPGFFDGRYLIEIMGWDWTLYVGISHPSTPVEHRFQGGLNYSRGIEVAGRVRAPAIHRGKRVRIWVSPFGAETAFGAEGLGDVGRLYTNRADALKSDLQVSLNLPEVALSPALTSLASVWKYLDIWTSDDGQDEADVTAYSFSASIHPNLAGWAGLEFNAD